jgi:hypothetical protein
MSMEKKVGGKDGNGEVYRPDWLGAGGRCRCRCRCCGGLAGEMQLVAECWARSYWVRWRNWQRKTGGDHWPGGRTTCSSDAESKGAQLISRLSTLWGKFVPLPVRRAMLHYEFTRCLSVFSRQPITYRSSIMEMEMEMEISPRRCSYTTQNPPSSRPSLIDSSCHCGQRCPHGEFLNHHELQLHRPGVHQLLRPWLPKLDLQT